MIRNTVLSPVSYYYALANTPPVSLTQDLPPEQDADILLLGCGDARNILFTCYADNARKIDVTCCDIEPGIHARNILLYTLLIDDEANHNIEHIWSIYHHWNIYEDSFEFLETQIKKLLPLSESIDLWHSSVYGSSIRFCDERSLSAVRRYWLGFTSQGLSPSEKADRQRQLQSAIVNAKACRESMIKNSSSSGGPNCRSVNPIIGINIHEDFHLAATQWWECGMLPSLDSFLPTHLNPAFLFSSNPGLKLHFCLFPLYGFPLSTAYAPVSKESAFFVEKKTAPLEHLINCAKNHFTQWASAFRKAIANKSVIRIFSGDAIAFCFTLHNCQLTQSGSMNLFCHNFTNSPLVLHHSDYGQNQNSAPLSFDVIDASNLVDSLGSLNLMPLASVLLKRQVSSSIYTESVIQHDYNVAMAQFFVIDLFLMSFLLGLVEPTLVVSATNSVEEEIWACDRLKELRDSKDPNNPQLRIRLRWKRLGKCQTSSTPPFARIEAKALAKTLINIHDTMFKNEDCFLVYRHDAVRYSSIISREIAKLDCPPYNRASFAFLLSVIKANVLTDWDECVQNFYDQILQNKPLALFKLNFAEDLKLNMHVFGVDNGRFRKPTSADMKNAVLASILPSSKNAPEQLCVTVRVSREHIRVNKKGECAGIICSFEGKDSHGSRWTNFFSAVKITFGKWHEQVKEDGSYPYIEEDSDQFVGSSDMFVSVIVPTVMLLRFKKLVPLVKCKLIPTVQNLIEFQKTLGPDLCFASSKLISQDVFITQFMPGMSALPKFVLSNNKRAASAISTTLELIEDGSEIKSLIGRVDVKSERAKAKMMDPDSGTLSFKSPFTAVFNIAGCCEVKVEFPIPVSTSKCYSAGTVKTSHVQIEARLFDNLGLEGVFFLFPAILMKSSCGATVPALWASTRLNLDALPVLDIKDSETLRPWLKLHIGCMLSVGEHRIRESYDAEYFRANLKATLFSIFMEYTGQQGDQIEFFALKKKNRKELIALILPSCLRLDLANYTVVLDCAIIPLTRAFHNDSRATRLLKELNICVLRHNDVSGLEYLAWKSMMPSLVERCRTWKHTPSCEYVLADEVPLSKGLGEDGDSPICSCGIGKFPTTNYLKNQTQRFSDLSYVLDRFATRAAIAPIFSIPYVEDCATGEALAAIKEMAEQRSGDSPMQIINFYSSADQEKCEKCGSGQRKNAQAGEGSLLTCSKCKMAKYCSKDCQKVDWKAHKRSCKAPQK